MRNVLRKSPPSRLSAIADEELMGLVGDRDPDAFEAFYDRHAGSAYSLAYRMVGDQHRAEDITQEALLSIWRTGARYDRSKGSVRSWVLGITRNRAIDVLRAGSISTRKLDHDDVAILEAEAASEGTESEALQRETSRELAEAVGTLPDEQARVVTLAYYGGFSQSEIAEMLGEPLGTVKGRMRLGLEKIRLAVAEGLV